MKTQSIAIAGIAAANTAKVDHSRDVDEDNSDDIALYVDEENQYH